MTSASGPWGSGSASYNVLNNVRTRTLGSRNITINYDTSKNRVNQSVDSLSTGSGGTGTRAVDYDNRGNVTSLGNLAMVYDYSDQPTLITGTADGVGSANGSFLYDGNLKRVRSIVNGKTIYNVYDASGKLVHVHKVAGSGQALERSDYVSAGGKAIARVVAGGEAHYTFSDHLGSPVTTINATTGDIERERYTPFGIATHDPDVLKDQAGFTGHIKDSATGLNYMQARYYDPVIGRFLSVDPVTFMETGEPGYFNRYSYTMNDPINLIDPTGESAVGFTDADRETLSKIDPAPPTKEELKDIGVALLPGSGIASAKSNIEEGNYGMAAFDIATEIPLLKLGKLGKLGKAGCCFVAGTLVDTETGLRPIEEIEVGDFVLSRNPDTGETAYKEVTAFIPRHDRVIWKVSLSGANGTSENFETTDEHPWWVAGQIGDVGWKRTDELIAGMFVTKADNQTMKVTTVLETGRLEGTYNITVAEFETYFVGTNKVLVHNCGGLKAGKGNKNFEQDGDAVQFEFDTSSGSATVMGNVSQSGGHMVMDQVHTAGSMTAREGLKAANNFAAANGAKSFTVQGGAMKVRGGARPKPIGPIKVKPPK